jgi:hypothetical protein
MLTVPVLGCSSSPLDAALGILGQSRALSSRNPSVLSSAPQFIRGLGSMCNLEQPTATQQHVVMVEKGYRSGK